MLFQAIGGIDGCRKLSAAFYARVERDPLLRPLFPSTFRCAIEALAAFLAQFLGGPSEYAQPRWSLSLRESHLRFKIGRKERDAWIKNMLKALDDVRIEEPAHSALRWFFQQSSAYLVNQGPAPATAEDQNSIREEIVERWAALRALEETVAAVRGGDANHALALAESPLLQTSFKGDRAGLLSLLELMSGSGHAAMLDYVRQKLTSDPALARERYAYGRTLLHGASGAGSASTVDLLLRLGAAPNATDQGGHTPLYCVGNECTAASGGDVVRVLAQGGANVDSHDGVKHCTPLHMAARRGNVEVAAALLDCGANIDARDSVGDTPLRRAVNCGKSGMVTLLVSRGADIDSKGNKGLTPLQAARTAVMKKLIHHRLKPVPRVSTFLFLTNSRFYVFICIDENKGGSQPA
jgi:truncated hemoglobin YjbI